MSRRDLFLWCLCFLLIAEDLSWVTASWPGPCLVQEESVQKTSDHIDQKDCATFLAGMVLVAGRSVDWIKRDENDKAIVAAFTIVLALSTIGLWTATLRLWGAARDTAEQQSKDTEIIQRAYISVEPGGMKPFEGSGTDDRVACNIVINNAGNLPARKLSWVINRAFSADAYRKDFQITGVEVGNIVLAPKVVAVKGANSVQTAEFDDAAEGAKPDQAWLYVWGRISYHDGFRDGRWTEFCHRYNLLGAIDYIVPKDNGRYHEYGNQTDET